jgi:phosphoribosylglycinamide formyltransferase 1
VTGSASGKRLPVAVLISGGGTTLRNLLDVIDLGQLPLDVRLIISSRRQAAGLQYAERAGCPTEIIRRRDFELPEAHRDAVFAACRSAGVDLVVMGGYLEHLLIPDDFTHRVVNIHPSLIPAFCGQGFYGLRVHAAVLEYGVKLSGCTVHFVDNQYDHGPIILQRAVPVLDDDTPSTLAERVFAEECRAYPEALRWLAEGRVSVRGRQVRVV